MDVFEIKDRVISDYSGYVKSFIRIQDDQVREKIDASIDGGDLWPEALVQLNPAYARAENTEELIEEGIFHPSMRDVFPGFQLYKHQVEALRRGARGAPFIVTSGTGSGKSLTFFGTIINDILNNPEPSGVRAIIIYPMNALINSQENEFRAYAANYRERTGQVLPVRLAKYTGQEGGDDRQRILADPPHIILTNFMMMEYIMMRGAERDLRASIAKNLQFLVFDELHTYRGRQGSDVALLNRRLQELRGKSLHFIGTSATMVSGPGSTSERREAVAHVGTTLFGVPVGPDAVIEEALVATFNADESTLKSRVINEIEKGIQASASEAQLARSPTAYWLESRIGLQKEDGELRRRKPLTLPQIAKALSEFTGSDEQACERHLRNLLVWVNQVNMLRVQQGEKRELLPFKLHQFIAQSGSVYSTLDHRNSREITLEAGISIKAEGEDERSIFPIVFSRASGWDYYVVSWDQSADRIWPRDFSSRLPTGVEEEDDLAQTNDGYIVIDYDGGGSSLFSLETMKEDLPPTWFTGTGKPKSAHVHKLPQRVWLSKDGRCSDHRSDECNIGGFFVSTPMHIDVTSGELFVRARGDYAKLTSLGSEARSTSTTILSTSLIDQLVEREGAESAVAKTLCFTDNRQDASLQAGHFNDFGRVLTIRGGLYRALKANPGGLDYATIGPEIRAHIGLREADYAINVDPYGPDASNQKAFERLVTLRSLEDLERGWRITLPNLEQCGLLQVVYDGLEDLASHDRWDGFAPFEGVSPADRYRFLFDFASYLRTEYAVSLQLTKPEQLEMHAKRISERIHPEWGVPDANHRFQLPTLFTLSPTGKVKARSVRSAGYLSTLGRFLKQHELFADHIKGRDNFDDVVAGLLERLEGAFLTVSKTNLKGGGETKLYAIDGTKIRWKLGSGTVPDTEVVRSRRLQSHAHQKQANAFFRDRYTRPLPKLYKASDHTAQVNNDDRQDREKAFREGALQALYCSPTMELGIDISDLTVVQMRNIPPNPASYTQRSGRAGRGGQAALVMAYAAHRSPHDQNFFRNRLDMVAGVVDAPQLDLSNQALVRTHLHARYVTLVDLDDLLKADQGSGIGSLLQLNDPEFPLKPEVKEQLSLTDEQRRSLEDFTRVLIATLGEHRHRFNDQWITNTVRSISAELDSALDRWRVLFRTNQDRMAHAQKVQADMLGAFTAEDKRVAEIEIKRCQSLAIQLLSKGSRSNDNEFYPYRYLATEGFLPGYNFPTRPIRAQVRSTRDSFDYISRSRKVGIREFGPLNVIYHNGGKHTVESLTIDKTQELSFLLEQPIVSNKSGYVFFGSKADTKNTDPILGLPLDGDAAQTVLPHSARLVEVRTMSREYISCEEEERAREGFVMETYFAVDEVEKLQHAPRLELSEGGQQLIDVRFIQSARLFHFNLGWQRERERGYTVSEASGSILRGKKLERALEKDERVATGISLYTDEVTDAVFIQPMAALGLEQEGVITLQYALEHALSEVFSVEDRELGSLLIGNVEGRPNIMLYESSEGSLGVLSQLFDKPETWKEVLQSVRSICAFDNEEEDERRPRASYQDLLSYANQTHHAVMDRHLIRDATSRLLEATVRISKGESYDDRYQRLLRSYDTESHLERVFLKYLYERKLALPDAAQKTFKGMWVKPDFFYEEYRTCIFIDGNVHDKPYVAEGDTAKRQALRDAGYEVLSYDYMNDLASFVEQHNYLFKKIEA